MMIEVSKDGHEEATPSTILPQWANLHQDLQEKIPRIVINRLQDLLSL